MKIALATDDRQYIAKRTGRAKEFVIYTIENGKIQNIEFKENLHKHYHDHDEEHEHSHRHGRKHKHQHTGHHKHEHGAHHHDEVVEVLKDVDVLLYKALGKYMRQDMLDAKINVKRTSKEMLEEAIREFLAEK